MTGNTYSVSVRTPEILDKLEKHPIWQQRAEEKARGQQAGTVVGTGVACATKDYGSGADCSLGTVEIDPDGQISIHCDHTEMGNGIGTALANRVAAHMGRVADEVAIARVDTFDALALVTSGDPHTMDQATQSTAQRNPRWVPGDQFSYDCLDWRSCWDACGGRGRTRRVPLRVVAGSARIVARCANRSKGQGVDEGELERRTADHAGVGTAGVAGGCGKGACAQFRDRRDGAQLFPLGMVAGDLRDRRTAMDGRY